MSDAVDLPDAPVYNDALEEVRARTGIRLYPAYPPPLRALDARNLAAADVPAEVLQAFLQSDRAGIVNFAVEKLKQFDGVQGEQDYPAGEEPGPEDTDSNQRSQGYSKGFLLISLLEYYLLVRRPESVESFVKARRIPRAKQYVADLRTVFERARALAPG